MALVSNRMQRMAKSSLNILSRRIRGRNNRKNEGIWSKHFCEDKDGLVILVGNEVDGSAVYALVFSFREGRGSGSEGD
jgi:hypothetical protein